MESTADNSEWVLFQGKAPVLKPGQVEEQSGFGVISGLIFGRKLEDVKADWAKVSGQIQQMLQATAATVAKNFTMDTVEIALGFSAKGELVFVAEAGVEATVTVTFQRVTDSAMKPVTSGDG